MIPVFLASLCNNMSANGSVCQGFSLYNSSDEQIAWFKGHTSAMPIDFGEACWDTNSTTWILAAGRLLDTHLDVYVHLYCHLTAAQKLG